MSKPNLEEVRNKICEKFKTGGWYNVMRGFLLSKQMDDLLEALWTESFENRHFTPTLKDVFRVFEVTPWKDLCIIMCSQDSYPALGVADGIAFSTRQEKTPASLEVMFKAIDKTIYGNTGTYTHSNSLEDWSQQGILLLNCALTCQVGFSGTHYEIWQPFLNYTLGMIDSVHPGIPWIVLGKVAEENTRKVRGPRFIASHPASAVHSTREWESKGVFKAAADLVKLTNNMTVKW